MRRVSVAGETRRGREVGKGVCPLLQEDAPPPTHTHPPTHSVLLPAASCDRSPHHPMHRSMQTRRARTCLRWTHWWRSAPRWPRSRPPTSCAATCRWAWRWGLAPPADCFCLLQASRLAVDNEPAPQLAGAGPGLASSAPAPSRFAEAGL